MCSTWPLRPSSVVFSPRCIVPTDNYQSFRVANEREPEAMVRLQQQLKPETLKDCQQHFADAQTQQAAAAAAAAAGGVAPA